ncbi:response regulator [Arcticibacter sp. MXS-1]|uniref:response regulator n=1 Tax=Arcticibacter sp. MXS-1 TaxID=3341726 RepID=UPI0035A8A84D
MLKNVLLAEDYENTSLTIRKTLANFGIAATDEAHHIEDALVKIAERVEEDPYDLLITDLSLREEGQIQKTGGGQGLIAAARQIQPDLKVLVFSRESKAAVIEKLFNDLNVDGYVRRGHNDTHELRLALENIARNRRYFPPELRLMIKQKNTYDFTEFDILIVLLLSQGMRQKDIPNYLKENLITPSGLSSVEKRLRRMKEALGFSKNEQLVAFCKDMGII